MADEWGNLATSAAVNYGPAAYQGYKAAKRMQPFVQGSIDSAQGAQAGQWGAQLAQATGVSARVAETAVGGAVRSAAAPLVESTGVSAARGAAGAVRGAVVDAAAPAVARIGASLGISALSGAAEGAAAGSVVPGVGTAIGAVAGAVAPLIIPHIPGVGDAVNKVPIIGGILSPKHGKGKTKQVNTEGESYRTNPHIQSGGEYAQNQRAEYAAGRGFRR